MCDKTVRPKKCVTTEKFPWTLIYVTYRYSKCDIKTTCKLLKNGLKYFGQDVTLLAIEIGAHQTITKQRQKSLGKNEKTPV